MRTRVSKTSPIFSPSSFSSGLLFFALLGFFLEVGFAIAMISSTVRTDKPSATIRLANFSIAAESVNPRSARAWPALMVPAATFC